MPSDNNFGEKLIQQINSFPFNCNAIKVKKAEETIQQMKDAVQQSSQNGKLSTTYKIKDYEKTSRYASSLGECNKIDMDLLTEKINTDNQLCPLIQQGRLKITTSKYSYSHSCDDAGCYTAEGTSFLFEIVPNPVKN